VPLEEVKVAEKDQDKDWHTDSNGSDDDSKPPAELMPDIAMKISASDDLMPELVQEQIYQE
jgi:hypothetical protein